MSSEPRGYHGDQLDASTAIVDGYNSYFSFSRKRSGYSGVATFCRTSVTPWRAEEGLSGALYSHKDKDVIGCYGNLSHFTDDELESLDAEGRAVITEHKIRTTLGLEKDVCVINVYCPRADYEREDRKLYKLRFYALLQTRAEALLRSGSHVVILGDINSTHKPIDHCDHQDEEYQQVRPGRLWMNQLIWEPGRDPNLVANDDEKASLPGTTADTEGGRFVDTFRHFYPEQREAYTNWCTLTGARQTNYGRRLDYIFGDIELTKASITDVIIMPEVEGSDHCPVRADLNCASIAARKCPLLCTKYMPEFSGKQQRLSDLFSKAATQNNKSVTISENLIQKHSSSIHSDRDGLLASRQGDSTYKSTGTSSEKSDTLKRKLVTEKERSSRSKKLKSSVHVQQSNLMRFFNKSESKLKNTDFAESLTSTNVHTSMSEVSTEKSVERIEKERLNADISPVMDSAEDSDIRLSGESTSCSNSKTRQPNMNKTDLGQSQSSGSQKKLSAALAWRNLLSGPGKAPLCKGHNEPCVLRTVKKDGPNKGRQFYVCVRGEGHNSNPEARCDFFKWVERTKLPTPKSLT